MKANGSNFASLGPFDVAFEPFTFQHLWVCLRGCERGNIVRVCSNLLPVAAYAGKAGLAREARWARWRNTSRSLFRLGSLPSPSCLVVKIPEDEGESHELEGNSSQIVAIGVEPLNGFLETFAQVMSGLKPEELLWPG